MAYPGTYTPALSHRTFSGRTNYPYSPRTAGYTDDYSRYPYGEPVRSAGGTAAAYDESAYTGYGDTYQSPAAQTPYSSYGTPHSSYGTPRLGGYHGSGAYDDLAISSRPSYYGNNNDYDYTSYNAGSLTPVPRQRRSSSVSFHHQLSSGPHRASIYGSYDHRGRSQAIKFRVKGSMRSGMSLADAVSGVKLSGGDYLKWHEINADARGRIYLRVKWSGYAALTYEIPVDGYDNRVRLSSLARRVARACIHFMQSNSIPISWDRVKLYYLEEVSYGVWQPALTVR